MANQIAVKDAQPGMVVQLPPTQAEPLRFLVTNKPACYDYRYATLQGSYVLNERVQSFTRNYLAALTCDVVAPESASPMLRDICAHFSKNVSVTLQVSHIGTDPEIFVEDENGAVIPAFDFLWAKTDKRLGPYTPFWDGFQAEFRTPSKLCLEELSKSVRNGLISLLMLARGHNPKAKLALKTVVPVSAELLQKEKREHVILGCDPSDNIYGLHGLCVGDARLLDIRFAGGHLHFGQKGLPHTTITEIIKTLDAIAGVVSVSLFGSIENPIRRKFYGLPGEYRLPEHGIEYRTLGNGWLCAPGAMHLMWDIARSAYDIGRRHLRAVWEYDEQEMIETIINGDVKTARKILTANKDLLKGILTSVYNYYHPSQSVKWGMRAIFEGIEAAVKDPLDVEGNWHLTDYAGCGNCGGPFGVCLEGYRWSTLAHTLK